MQKSDDKNHKPQTPLGHIGIIWGDPEQLRRGVHLEQMSIFKLLDILVIVCHSGFLFALRSIQDCRT